MGGVLSDWSNSNGGTVQEKVQTKLHRRGLKVYPCTNVPRHHYNVSMFSDLQHTQNLLSVHVCVHEHVFLFYSALCVRQIVI